MPNNPSTKTTRYIFVTGGVVSSLGKGIAAASLGRLLVERGLTVSIMKFDPYLNVDPGTMSPYQHGEVYVTDDGAETDLDLGHYERFTGVASARSDNVTAGRIYQNILARERQGLYLGRTVQVIPHITNEIKDAVRLAADDVDVLLVEQRPSLARQVIPPERGHARIDPRILARVVAPEMHVGVDARHGR